MITTAPISKTGAFKEEMKMRKSKLIRLAFLCAAFCLTVTCAVLFGGTTNAVSARAEATTSSTFEVSVGASVRLSESTGLRFIVKMDETLAAKIKTDDNIALKFLISPQYYFNKITDGDYKKLEKKVEITVDKNKIYAGSGEYSGYYLANGVISEIKSQNRQIEFNAVAYYEENGSTVYSAMPENNERSFYYVTNKAFILGEQRYADLILSLNSYDWYGKADAPVSVTTDEEYEAIAERINSGALDLDNMNVTVGESVNRVTEITVKKYKYGDTIYDSMPTGVAKESDEKNHYDFKGWKLAANSLTVYEPEFTAVAHSVKEWNTENAEYDVAICHCGKTLAERFDKVVTDERQDVILTDGSKAITLGGISAYKTIKSIKYSEIDLGTDISALTIPEEMNNAVHGEQTLTVVVTDNYGSDHTVLVPVTIITKSIGTFDELVNCVTFKPGCPAEYQKWKYFTLANDINVTSYNTGSAQTWGSGFAGTLDGRNYSLIGGEMYVGGLFGVLNGATIKNIKFKNVSVGGVSGNRVLIAHHIRLSTISDVEIYITDKLDMLNQQQQQNSVIARGHVQELKLYNVLIDASGSKLPFIFGSGAFAANVTKAENVTVIADEVECLINYQGQIKSIEGITVIIPKKLTNNNDIILKDKDGVKTNFTVNLGEYADYTIKSVKFGDNDLQFSGTTVAISDEIKNGTHGANSLTVTAAKDSATVILSVPVTIVTESISTIERLKAVVGYTDSMTGRICEGKYYILAGDITHGTSYSGMKNNAAIGNGFAGTLDGRGHSLIGGNFYGGGLFGSIDGGTVKNLKFSGVNPVGANRTLLASTVYNATLENIEIKTYKVELGAPGTYFGVIASHRIANITMKNVTIDMTGSTLPWIFGCGWDNSKASNYKCENVIIKVKTLNCLAKNSNPDGALLANDGVSGLRVIKAE